MSTLAWTVPGQHGGRELEILSQVHSNQVRCKKEKEGRVQLPALDGRMPLQQRAKLDSEDIHHLDRGFVGPERAEGFQMCFAGLSSDDEELPDACPLFPGLDKFVHDPVKRSTSKRGPARKGPGRGVHAVLDRGGACNAEFLGQIVCQTLHDDGIAPKG